MRFCFVLTDLSGGGAEKAVINISRELVNRGHAVDIVLFRNLVKYEIHPSIGLTIISNNPSFGWFGKRILAFSLFKTIKKLEKIKVFDAIVSTLPLADEIAVIAKLPNLWCRIANTLSIEIEVLSQVNSRKSQRRLKRYQNIYRNKNLIAVSAGVKSDLEEKLYIKAKEIRVIYNPFNFESIRRESTRKLDIPYPTYIIHVGRFSSQKRHDVLLDAYRKMHNSHSLVLLTDKHPKLIEMIQKRGLSDKVVITGFQSNPYPWILNAELLVLSSEREGMPNVLIESLIIGTSVVSTDCPSGPREVLGSKFPQFLSPVNDSESLSKNIDKALDSKVDMKSVDLNQFHLKNSIDDYEFLVRRI